MRAVFLNREGTVVLEPYDQILDNPAKFYLFEDTISALSRLAKLDYTVFLAVNEQGLAQKRITEEQFIALNSHLMQMLEPSGIKIEKVYYCPHAPFEGCDCRKPKPGLVQQATAEYPIDIAESWVIGDRLQDAGMGKAAGIQTILIDREGRFSEGTADYIVSSLSEAVSVLDTPPASQF